jgi:hypothetical protein
LSATESDPQKLQKVHTESLQEIKRLQRLSDVLLGREDSQIRAIEARVVVEKVWENLQPLNRTGFELEGSLPCLTKEMLFYHSVYNLLRNTLKHGESTELIKVKLEPGQMVGQNPTLATDFQPGLGLQTCRQVVRELSAVFQTTIENLLDKAYFVAMVNFK